MKNLFIFLLIALLFTNCEDFLTRNHPTGITDDQFWETSIQIDQALSGCYNFPHGTYHYTDPYASEVHFEGLTDNAFHPGDFLSYVTRIANGSITPTDGGINNFWMSRYSSIRSCSRLLEHLDNAFFIEEKERERIRGEAIVLRAYYHWDIMRFWGLSEGIPIVDHALTPNENYQERKTTEQVYDFILSELDRAIAIPDFSFKLEDSRKSNKVDKSVAYALKAIVALNAKRYDVARQAAKFIIDSNIYELYYGTSTDNDPAKHFRDLFFTVGQNNKERILYVANGLREATFRLAGPGSGNQCATNPTLSIVNAFETKQGFTLEELGQDSIDIYSKDPLYKNNRDPRLYSTIYLPGDNTTMVNYTYLPFADGPDAVGKTNASRTGFMLKKFIDPEDRTRPYSGTNSFYLIRYAEILLIYVEALIESGDWQHPDVLKYINDIRRRSGHIDASATKYNTLEKTRELLRRERRVELAFEGQRYVDIRRWNIVKDVMSGPLYGAINPTTNYKIQVETRTFIENRNEVWPIPQNEILANMNLNQNRGYEDND